jgi:integrase
VVFGTPKTRRSQRPVSMSADLVVSLRATDWRRRKRNSGWGPLYEDSGLLFAAGNGHTWDGIFVSRAWRGIAKEAGVEGTRCHDPGHTHASIMFKAGVAAKIVSERLGLNRIRITLDTHSHVLPGLQDDAAKRFDAEMCRLG